jgi:hypothetical protein
VASFSGIAGLMLLTVSLFDDLVHFLLMSNLYSSIMIPRNENCKLWVIKVMENGPDDLVAVAQGGRNSLN